MSSPIQCEGLSKRFGRVSAVADLHMDVPEGSIYTLVGPNGAGKTTLIKMLVNILQPTAGKCSVLGTESRRLAPAEFEEIGYVSENQELPAWMTVDYFLGYLKPFYRRWDDELATELVREFQLPGDRRLSQLSRGMKMKVALASSLAYHPRLIVLDEPFSGLDPLVRGEFIEGLLERATETTIFVSSHDLAELESFASHVGFMDAGRLQFSEETAVLAERFREIEITVPGALVLPSTWPEGWSAPQRSAATVRFIDSRFEADRTPGEIASCFAGALNVSINPMSLGEIFVAVARERPALPDKADIGISYDLGRNVTFETNRESHRLGGYVLVSIPLTVTGMPQKTLLRGSASVSINVGGRAWPQPGTFVGSAIEQINNEYWQTLNVQQSKAEILGQQSVEVRSPFDLEIVSDEVKTRVPIHVKSFFLAGVRLCRSFRSDLALQLVCRAGLEPAEETAVRLDSPEGHGEIAGVLMERSIPWGLSPVSDQMASDFSNAKPGSEFAFFHGADL